MKNKKQSPNLKGSSNLYEAPEAKWTKEAQAMALSEVWKG